MRGPGKLLGTERKDYVVKDASMPRNVGQYLA
jgi:hypothetical protein